MQNSEDIFDSFLPELVPEKAEYHEIKKPKETDSILTQPKIQPFGCVDYKASLREQWFNDGEFKPVT